MSSQHSILVTGANGFLGQGLCKALAQRTCVRAVTRSKSRALENERIDQCYGELSSSFDWSPALTNVRSVVHCAARVHVMTEVADDPLREFRAINVDGTMNLARQAVNAGVKRFIFISSIGVNGGESSVKPFLASDRPEPHTPYAVSKYEAEVALQRLADESGLEVVIIRPPLIYGAYAPGNFASLMKFAASGIPLPLGAVTSNRRSFVYLENLISLIETCLDHPAAANQIFLVSDGEDLSTAALLRRLGNVLGRPARLIPVPVSLLMLGAALLGKPDMAQRLCGSLVVDICKTREMLGWLPPFSVEEGLQRTVERWNRSS